MRRYLVLSGSGHLLFLAGWAIFGALLSKPRMSYYAVDLVSSLPAGGPVTPAPIVEEEEESPRTPPPPKAIEEKKLPPKEVIKIQAKPKRKEPPPTPPKEKKGINLKAALAAMDNQKGTRTQTGIPAAAASGISADAGPAFPFPWYLKTIADKLNQQWKPAREFQEDMMCQIAFTIQKDGEIVGAAVEKSSGDSTFDQMAQRAVLYSNPLPPLPNGYPEESLRVHMKFVGKPF